MCNSVGFLVYSQCYATIITISFQNIFITTNRSPISISSHLPIPSAYSLATTNLLFSRSLSILDISYKWNLKVCGLFYLTSYI